LRLTAEALQGEKCLVSLAVERAVHHRLCHSVERAKEQGEEQHGQQETPEALESSAQEPLQHIEGQHVRHCDQHSEDEIRQDAPRNCRDVQQPVLEQGDARDNAEDDVGPDGDRRKIREQVEQGPDERQGSSSDQVEKAVSLLEGRECAIAPQECVHAGEQEGDSGEDRGDRQRAGYWCVAVLLESKILHQQRRRSREDEDGQDAVRHDEFAAAPDRAGILEREMIEAEKQCNDGNCHDSVPRKSDSCVGTQAHANIGGPPQHEFRHHEDESPAAAGGRRPLDHDGNDRQAGRNGNCGRQYIGKSTDLRH